MQSSFFYLYKAFFLVLSCSDSCYITDLVPSIFLWYYITKFSMIII